MRIEAGIVKWENCRYALSTSPGGEEGYALSKKGIQNYLCEHPGIVNSGRYTTVQFFEKGEFKSAAELHHIARAYGDHVARALIESCANCQYYEKK